MTNNIIESKNGYYIKEENEYKFLPFEKLYSAEELLEILNNLKDKNLL